MKVVFGELSPDEYLRQGILSAFLSLSFFSLHVRLVSRPYHEQASYSNILSYLWTPDIPLLTFAPALTWP